MISYLIKMHHLDVNGSDQCGGLNELDRCNFTDSLGSPLNYAIKWSNLAAIETLLKCGAEIGGAWVWAIMKENKPALKLLLDAGPMTRYCCVPGSSSKVAVVMIRE